MINDRLKVSTVSSTYTQAIGEKYISNLIVVII
jgi:hypothetical protein